MFAPSTPEHAAERASRAPFRSKAELAMRAAVERWGRARWPEARVVHELVMDRGTVRADVAFVAPAHFVAVEIKSEYDDTRRLIHQAGMYRLAVPEVWIVAPHRHADDVELLGYLIPSLGLAQTDRDRAIGPLPDVFEIETTREPQPFAPVPRCALSLLWVAELADEARRARILAGGRPPSHARLVAMLVEALRPEEIIRAVCRQLRSRDAFWRADPPVAADGAVQ